MMGEQFTEDRSRWRYEQGGPALGVAIRFVGMLKEADVTDRLDEVRMLVTETSWPRWRMAIAEGLNMHWLLEFTHVSLTVRHPADGMAYVIYIVTHPDHQEPMVIDGPQTVNANIATLLQERGEWRVHQLGEALSPMAVGLVPYSW